jgi:hypothetical protein
MGCTIQNSTPKFNTKEECAPGRPEEKKKEPDNEATYIRIRDAPQCIGQDQRRCRPQAAHQHMTEALYTKLIIRRTRFIICALERADTLKGAQRAVKELSAKVGTERYVPVDRSTGRDGEEHAGN